MSRSIKRATLAAIALIAASFLFAACGGDAAPTSTQAPRQAEPTAAPETSAEDKAAMEAAEALLKAAQAEGEVVSFICCGTGRSIGKLIPEFESKYGIKWVNSTGSSRQNSEKVMAEQSAGKYTLDIWMGGANTATTRLLPNNVLQPLKPLLSWPEVLDESLWYGPEGKGGHIWRDPEEYGGQHVFAFGGDASGGGIAYNTNLIDPSTIKSYYDLLKPELKGKIVMRDPRLQGTGASSAFMIHHPDLGPDYFRRLLTEMDARIVDDARQAAEWLALGRYSICLFACGTEVEAARDQGLPVNEELPHALVEGADISVGGSSLYVPRNSPHPNATKFFVNWWLSKEGQHDFYQESTGSNSLRSDIPKDNVDEEHILKDGTSYIFFDARPELDVNAGINLAREILGEVTTAQ